MGSTAASAAATTSSMSEGTRLNCLRMRMRVSGFMVPRSSASRSASRYITATCETKVLVAATPISIPARVSSTPSASRVACEPTMLVIASTRAPRSRASRIAASVSAVSPDWVMPITRSPGPTTGSR